MQYLLTAEQMRAADTATSERFGVPPIVLMERAALSLADEVMKNAAPDADIIIAAGSGNNGADGLAAGRILCERGMHVRFYCSLVQGDGTVSSRKTTESMKTQLSILRAYGYKAHPLEELSSSGGETPDIIVDSIFGIGLSREPEGQFAGAISAVNRMRELGAKVISCDIPSGLNADTGRPMGGCCPVCADITVCMGFIKRGEMLYPGARYCGKIVRADIGIPKRSLCGEPLLFCYDTKSEADLLPARRPDGNKGTFGKLSVFAGSNCMSGAALLCSEAAYRNGCGMVRVVTDEANRVIVQSSLPEALLTTYVPADPESIRRAVHAAVSFADTLCAGPGIGRTEAAGIMLSEILRVCAESKGRFRALVLDADALRLIAASQEMEEQMTAAAGACNVILTPHLAECADLLHVSIKTLSDDLFRLLKQYADSHHCTILCKSARSVAVSCNRDKIYLNVSGNSGLSTAGSGDVLAGMTTAFAAVMEDPFAAVCAASWLHGRRAESLSAQEGERSVLASDLFRGVRRLGLSGGGSSIG